MFVLRPLVTPLFSGKKIVCSSGAVNDILVLLVACLGETHNPKIFKKENKDILLRVIFPTSLISPQPSSLELGCSSNILRLSKPTIPSILCGAAGSATSGTDWLGFCNSMTHSLAFQGLRALCG